MWLRLELIDYLTHRVPFGRPVMDVTGCARIGLRHHRRPARGAGKPHPRRLPAFVHQQH